MYKYKDTYYDEDYIDEMIVCSDINSHLQDNKIYNQLDVQSRVIATKVIYDKYVDANIDGSYVEDFIDDNMKFVNEVLKDLAEESILRTEIKKINEKYGIK